ncbi:MAG TPA: protease complex subunit PrcB family protein, partial [Pyrinomonadaceae bacterium]|nr:protease complex subunit PrcB family protein [Pyrinomonadaceae bacterium]
MFGLKKGFVLGLALFVSHVAAAQACGSRQGDAAQSNKPSAGTPASTPTPAQKPSPPGQDRPGASAQPLTISEGGFGPVEEPFFAVIRDEETYATLRALLTDLPELRSDFFAGHTVIAAFLGTRPTGGYSVEIVNERGLLRVVEDTPPKDAMLTQAIGHPFKIVYVPTTASDAMRLELKGPWLGAMRSYRVGAGSFKQTGGIAGRSEEFGLKGSVQTARLGKLVTVGFDLTADKSEKARALRAFATGSARDGGAFQLPRLDAGTLVDPPNGGLRANGQLSDADGKLSLTFEPLPDNIADGF